MLLSSAHPSQIVRDNLVICELENIGLAGTAASTCVADPLPFEVTSATVLSRADLQALFSTLDLSSPSKSWCLVPLNSSVLAVLIDSSMPDLLSAGGVRILSANSC